MIEILKINANKWYLFTVVLVLSAILLVGCSSADPADNKEEAGEPGEQEPDVEEELATEPWAYDGEPVTLEMMIWIDPETFQMRFKDQIENEFPNITLEVVPGGDSREVLEEMFAKGEMPDIHVGVPRIELVEDLDFLAPIEDEYIIPRNFDLNIYQEGIIDNLRSQDPLGEGKLYGLPLENSIRTMFYNKDIFDRLGEPYPEDDMTWDEVLDLARRLTVEYDGTQYRGLAIDPGTMPYMQLSIPGTDPETGEVLFVDDPNTKKVLDLLDRYRSIPGMINQDPENSPDGFHDGQRNIAMTILNAPWFELLTREEGFNFDMVNVPTWEDQPGIAPTWGALAINITKHSENRDAAWSVVSYLASEEGQLNLSRAGSPPVIESEQAFEIFTADSIKDLDATFNVKAPFTQTLAKLPPYSKYDKELMAFLNIKLKEFLTSNQDAVTYLREMGEEYAGIVEELKGQE